MKHFAIILLFFITFQSSASTSSLQNRKKTADIEQVSTHFDKKKRINKKRKRKCNKWGKKSFAG